MLTYIMFTTAPSSWLCCFRFADEKTEAERSNFLRLTQLLRVKAGIQTQNLHQSPKYEEECVMKP